MWSVLTGCDKPYCLYNLQEIAYDIHGYIWKLQHFLIRFVYLVWRISYLEFDRVLHIDSNKQLLSYDTTISAGDFYVSPLIFRHVLFKEILVFQLTHEAMFKECVKLIPSLAKTC